MIKLLDTNLYVGSLLDSEYFFKDNWAVVHATQTVHYKLLGWDKTTNKPDKNHEHYIYFENESKLSLNWVDGAPHLYKWSGTETFNKILDFIDKWINEKNVLVHCDQGFSRSPSLCLLYLAKRANILSKDSFEEARRDFVEVYPEYIPGRLAKYINNNWHSLG